MTSLSLALVACGPKTEKAADSAANAAGDTLEAAGNIASNAVDATSNALTPTPTGQEFVNKAAKSDAFEIAAAKLAATNASSAAVKDFAAEMIKAHTASTAKIKAAASAASPAITPDPTLTSDQQEDLADLGKLKGADFDKSYIDGQEDAHQDALSLMNGYAKDGDVASLKAAAAAIAPVVAKHLDMVKALDK
jgi:putative membrane protein